MYVAGFVLAVKDRRKEDYLAMARRAAEVFMDHGALRVVEAWGVDVPEGKLTSFPMAVKREEGESVIFSWIEFPDRESCDRCMQASMEDPRMAEPEDRDIMDGRRMIYGYFEPLLDVSRG